MTEKETAAFKIVDEVCASFAGNRKEHVTIQASLQIIYTALNPKLGEKKIKVPKKALPRDRKRKGKRVKNNG